MSINWNARCNQLLTGHWKPSTKKSSQHQAWVFSSKAWASVGSRQHARIVKAMRVSKHWPLGARQMQWALTNETEQRDKRKQNNSKKIKKQKDKKSATTQSKKLASAESKISNDNSKHWAADLSKIWQLWYALHVLCFWLDFILYICSSCKTEHARGKGKHYWLTSSGNLRHWRQLTIFLQVVMGSSE